jgi:hypothetical protein
MEDIVEHPNRVQQIGDMVPMAQGIGGSFGRNHEVILVEVEVGAPLIRF